MVPWKPMMFKSQGATHFLASGLMKDSPPFSILQKLKVTSSLFM